LGRTSKLRPSTRRLLDPLTPEPTRPIHTAAEAG
jgi:hypothetical protein